MIKKLSTILIALTAFAFFAVPAKAQMTDDAVTTYVQEALAAGKSQQTILTELASRGVTKAQAERIKQNIQQTRSASAKSSFKPKALVMVEAILATSRVWVMRVR